MGLFGSSKRRGARSIDGRPDGLPERMRSDRSAADRTVVSLNVQGVPVQLVHKKVKRINLRVREDGLVTISVPVGVADKVALDFLREKWDWILAARDRQAGRRSEGKTVREYSERDRRVLKARVERLMPEIETRTGLCCSGWTVRKMTSRWGSCNTKTHHINLSLMLVDQSDEALEYVIVHELVHTRVSNHGPEFKAYMDRLMPNWRAVRKSM